MKFDKHPSYNYPHLHFIISFEMITGPGNHELELPILYTKKNIRREIDEIVDKHHRLGYYRIRNIKVQRA